MVESASSLSRIGIRSRRAWALRANVSPALLCKIVSGVKLLTPRVRRLLALAAGVCEQDVPALLASTRKVKP